MIIDVLKFLISWIPEKEEGKKAKNARLLVWTLLLGWLAYFSIFTAPKYFTQAQDNTKLLVGIDSSLKEMKEFVKDQARENRQNENDIQFFRNSMADMQSTVRGLEEDVSRVDDKCDNYLLEKFRKKPNATDQ